VHGVGCELAVAGDQGESLDPRLSDEHTIERVAMVERESPNLLHVLQRQRQKGKAGSLDPSSEGAASRSLPNEVLIATSQALARLT
jgi:hypothetical protein